MSYFKHRYSFRDRLDESRRILTQYPHRIPIICEKARIHKNNTLPNIDKHKYLVPSDLTIGQFIYVIRTRMSINADEAIFLFVSNNILPSSTTVGYIYDMYKDTDGFLYIKYAKENVFG